MGKKKQLDKKDRLLFTTGDPITWLFKHKYQVNTLLATLIIHLVLYLPLLISADINKVLEIPGSKLGLYEDYAAYAFLFLMNPATTFFFLWMPKGITSIFNGLVENKVILSSTDNKKNKADYDTFIDNFDKQYTNKFWWILSFFVMLLFVIFVFNPSVSDFTWRRIGGDFLFWGNGINAFVTFFMIALMVIRVLFLVYWLHQLFSKFDVNVKVLHPDGAGGLSPLGDFSVKLAYIIGIYGVGITVNMFGETFWVTGQFSLLVLWDNIIIISIVTYFLLAPIVFFAPIGAARSAMKKEKEEFILKISDEFEIEAEKVQSRLSLSANSLKKNLDKVKQLKELYEETKKFPVWPFNIENLVKFFSAVTSPVAISVLRFLVEKASIYINELIELQGLPK